MSELEPPQPGWWKAADGIWSTTVTNLRDITDDVPTDQFARAPTDDVIFAGFDVDMTLVQAQPQPLRVGLSFTYEILGGATERVYNKETVLRSQGCGQLQNEFSLGAEAFIDDTLSGTVCIPIPAADLADPDTRIALNFDGDRITFAPGQ